MLIDWEIGMCGNTDTEVVERAMLAAPPLRDFLRHRPWCLASRLAYSAVTTLRCVLYLREQRYAYSHVGRYRRINFFTNKCSRDLKFFF